MADWTGTFDSLLAVRSYRRRRGGKRRHLAVGLGGLSGLCLPRSIANLLNLLHLSISAGLGIVLGFTHFRLSRILPQSEIIHELTRQARLPIRRRPLDLWSVFRSVDGSVRSRGSHAQRNHYQ